LTAPAQALASRHLPNAFSPSAVLALADEFQI